MGNTNFQTFHQMGNAISDFVKQATGRENVQNIDIEHITVAQNHYYEDVDISGSAVVFSAGAEGIPFDKFLVQIKPVQDLHGYDHPWPGGGGKNLLDPAYRAVTVNNIRYYSNENKTFPAGTYTLSCDRVINGMYVATGNTSIAYKYETASLTFTITEDTPLHFNFYNSNGIDENMTCQLEVGSSATSFAPYANICPITGWTMVNVYQAGQSLADVRTFRFTFPSEAGIVYGGYADLVEGKLVVDRAGVDLGTLTWSSGFSGFMSRSLDDVMEPSVGVDSGTRLLCSAYPCLAYPGIDKSITRIYGGEGYSYNGVLLVKDSAYSSVNDFVTAMSGVQLVYELATPLEYSLSSSEAITTLKGINHIWADTGDIEVKFTDLKELY